MVTTSQLITASHFNVTGRSMRQTDNASSDHVVDTIRDDSSVRALWCDLDGEFLTAAGFTAHRCYSCARRAVLLHGDVPCCAMHLPAGLCVPNWLQELAPELLHS
jgi:hypothetical protein